MLVVQGTPVMVSSWSISFVSNPLPWLSTRGEPPWMMKSQERRLSSCAQDSTCLSASL